MHSDSFKTDERFIDMGPGKIYVKRWISPRGIDSEPILMIHDSLGSVKLWRDFPAKLCQATGRTIIAYDRLGFGQSDPRYGSLPAYFIREESGTCISAILTELGLERFIVLGHSVGGGMAAACASEFEGLCIGVITESAQAFVDEETKTGILKAKEHAGSHRHIERLKKYHGPKGDWVFHSWVNTWLAPEFSSWNLRADILSINCPLLVIHGDKDEYGSQKHPEAIRALSNGPSKMVILPNCGHIPHREKTNEVLNIVSDFIRHEIDGRNGLQGMAGLETWIA